MYTTESYKIPFWAENSGFMTGRDPLGVQNSSITTYSRLLPGMTNLTLRLRYYGLYMWLLNEYNEIASKDSRQTDQFTFVRRAELIVAFLMMKKFPGEQSIIGSDYTSRKVDEINQLGFYNIELGADKTKETKKGSVYWDFESGALGQYYAGSLIALELVDITGKFFRLLEKGKKLAKAFDQNISPQQKITFLEVIKEGKLHTEDLEKITNFSLSTIPVSSDEWTFYKHILISEDGIGLKDNMGIPTSLRKNSLKLFLEYIEIKDETFSDRSFIKFQHLLNAGKAMEDASYGWHYYYLNEAFHIALETIFWSILVEIEPREKVLNEFILKIVEEVILESEGNFLKDKSHLTLSEILKAITDTNVVVLLEELELKVKSNFNNKIALVLAFQLMLVLYLKNRDRMEELKQFELKYKIWGQKGRITENLNQFIHKNLEVPFSIFVRESIKLVLNDHVNTAYRKMGNGESNLLKFMIEDGLIFHIQTMTPRHTSPRLRALENFLKDLSLITKERTITEIGTNFLIELS
jgi:hypothetical protein